MLIGTSFTQHAPQPHGASISRSSLPSRPRVTARKECWIFRCSQCSSPAKMGSTLPRPAWYLWKKPELEGCLQTWSSIHRRTRTNEREGFLMNFGQPLLSKFPPLVTVLRNPWKALHLIHGGPVSVALVDTTKHKDEAWCWPPSNLVLSLSQQLAVPFPYCSCNKERHSFSVTWKCQIRARLGKKEAYQLPLKSEHRNNFWSKEMTTFISLHALCTSCFARFSVSPTCLRAKFWWIAPINILTLCSDSLKWRGEWSKTQDQWSNSAE